MRRASRYCSTPQKGDDDDDVKHHAIGNETTDLEMMIKISPYFLVLNSIENLKPILWMSVVLFVLNTEKCVCFWGIIFLSFKLFIYPNQKKATIVILLFKVVEIVFVKNCGL